MIGHTQLLTKTPMKCLKPQIENFPYVIFQFSFFIVPEASLEPFSDDK
jgi:hypothetical protein